MIRAGLRTYLMAQTSVTTLIGTRLYLSRVPDSGSYPCVVYRVTNVERPQHTLPRAPGIAEATIELEVYSDDSEEVEDICEALRLKLQGFTGAMGSVYVKRCTLDGEADEYFPPTTADDVGVHSTTLTYTLGYPESIPSF